jgi:oxygen-independent coproporphyrinogen-3 oxidase
MAGIYIHIPYCKVKCHYCDFHFSIQQKNIHQLMDAIEVELEMRKEYLKNEPIKTIYFGGGTPSIIGVHRIEGILNLIKKQHSIDTECEITLEANPDDITVEKLLAYKRFGINRLSIGIQSFNQHFLKFMNRAHSAIEAVNSIEIAQSVGFDNITIDLIYGIPGLSNEEWLNQLNQMIALNVQHLSAYCLTIESNTVFGSWQKSGKLVANEDYKSLEQFQILMDFAEENGFEQYEISNFAKKGFIAKHNSAYWLGTPYMGIGPSAHSYNIDSREWNIANNPLYIKKITNNEAFNEIELLKNEDKVNDYILTRLRTIWGVNINDIGNIDAKYKNIVRQKMQKFINSGELVKLSDTLFILSNSGKYRADGIAADLFV